MKILFIVVLILVIGLYFLQRFLKNVQPSSAEVEKDLNELKKKISQFKGGFMPWTDEISSNQIDQILTKDNARTGNGVFLSADSNPIFAYAYKNYIGPGKNAVIYILSHDHEYIFRITNKGTEVTIDQQKKGLIRENGVFYDLKNDAYAKVVPQGASGIKKLFIGDEEVAKIALPNAIATKAVDIVKIDLSPLEETTLKMIAIYELVSNLEQEEG